MSVCVCRVVVVVVVVFLLFLLLFFLLLLRPFWVARFSFYKLQKFGGLVSPLVSRPTVTRVHL